MKKKNILFRMTDIALICLAVIPIFVGMILKILFTTLSADISITGALIYFSVPMPFGTSLPITETQINSWLVIVSLFWLCLYLTHGIKKEGGGKRQIIAEWIVEKTDLLVRENMGGFFKGFSPFIAAVLSLSAFSSLLSLLGLYPPTSDLNTVAGWAVLVFVLITHYKLKCGPLQYIKSFAEPVAFFLPLNIISEVATPVSMTFRHYGNVLSGTVISALIMAGLGSLSNTVFGKFSEFLGQIPFFGIGIPALLSIYFDVFSGLLQAFIFAMLTMLYISSGFDTELYLKKHKKTN